MTEDEKINCGGVKMSLDNKEKVDISIIIPLYRGQKYCERLLKMIQRNCLYHELYKECVVEVVFVNDCPEEKIIIDKKGFSFEIKCVEHKKNMGIHAARVTGILHADGEYIIMFDQDDLAVEEWLYEQRKRIVLDALDFCVCNGWTSRFRILQEHSRLIEKVNNLEFYLEVGNAIVSPGQVMMRRSVIPDEWMTNIQKSNGADDYLLWVMVLKKGYVFGVNCKYLYYHTPERTEASIDDNKMIGSLEETSEILQKTNFLTAEESQLLEQQIKERKQRFQALQLSDFPENLEKYIKPKSGLKFRKMFFMMYDWMKLKNKGSGICDYLKSGGYLKIAIYGMGYIGECIYEELCHSKIQVSFAIDRLALDFKKELPIVKLEDEFEKVDLIITTVAEDISETIEILREKGECPVVTFSQLLKELSC